MNSKVFRWNTTIDLTDLDYMNIVGNAAWLLILQKARGDLLKQINYPLERLFSEGIGGVVQEAKITYIRSGKFLDEITVETIPAEPFETGAVLKHRIFHAKTGKLMIRANLAIVFIDSANGKGTAMPEEIRKALFG